MSLSADDSRLVVANRDVGTVTVFSAEYPAGETPKLTSLSEVAVGGEPWQVAVHPSGSFALAIARKDQKLVRIDGLAGTPAKGKELTVGSEPTGLALSPTGKTAFVADWVDGTIHVVDTESMTTTKVIDLNGTLAAAGYLGQVTGRAALAHPRTIAVTNNGDVIDADESVYVTEYFAQQKAPLAEKGANADVNKVGLVYKFSLAEATGTTAVAPTIIELPPLEDMGFHDMNDNQAGCYPNQVLSMQIQGSFGYVVSVCASPKGPIGVIKKAFATCTTDDNCPTKAAGSCDTTLVAPTCKTNCETNADCQKNGSTCLPNNTCAPTAANVKTTTAPVVSIIDLGGNKTIATVSLNKAFDDLYKSLGTPDTAVRRYPLVPMDVAFVPGTVTAYFPANGADSVFRVDFNATYEASTIDSLGDPSAPFINLVPPGVDGSRVGKSPIAMEVVQKTYPDKNAPRFAFVANESTRNVAVINLNDHEIAGAANGNPTVAASTAMPTDPHDSMVLEGKRIFGTGLGRWSMNGQGWGACQSCHIDGLTDNITWYFPRGPRQPNSLDGTFASKDPNDIRLGNWGALFDEIQDHEAGALRGTLGGVGAIVKSLELNGGARIDFEADKNGGLNGSAAMAADPNSTLTNKCAIDDWAKFVEYVKTIRSPRKPSNLDPAKVEEGKQVFLENNCQGCHSGAKWTISRVFYQPGSVGDLKAKSWTTAAAGVSFPAGLLPSTTEANQTMRYTGPVPADNDQMTCILRPVGTYGVAEDGVGVAEFRRDMNTPAQGNADVSRGYNPPSLLSTVTGAPYLHAGQARTLEALFSAKFGAHASAFSSTFPSGTDATSVAKRNALIQFLLSIDEDSQTVEIPALSDKGGDFCVTVPK